MGAEWVGPGTEKFHIICERDVGLFSLIQQVIANVPWAVRENRIPVVYFGGNTCYWTPHGYRGSHTVWEYYFKPLIPGYPASIIPEPIREKIRADRPSPTDVGDLVQDDFFVSRHFGDHPRLSGMTLKVTANPRARAFYENCGFTVEGEEQTRFGAALRMTR